MATNDDVTEELHRMSDDDRESKVLAAVKLYMRLLDSGSAPPLDQFIRQHGEIAEDLRPSLEGLALVHRAAEPKSSTLVAPDAEFTAKPIGDFQIIGELGRGGMGVVYEAIQLSLGRRVALKILPFASGLDEIRLQRFRNEAHAAAALHHTNIVPVYAVGSDRGIHYYAMQLIDGCTLGDLIEDMRKSDSFNPVLKGPPSPQESGRETLPTRLNNTLRSGTTADRHRYYRSVVRMAHQAALAIEHAHQYGIVHRDIKPANLLLDSAGKIWVTDFGLAQVQTEASNLTRTGDPLGTLRYMSPEQASGKRDELDHRSDIYSLGVTLYELLTLQPAIKGEGYREMLNNVALHDPPAPRSIDPSLPIELDTIVRKAIAKTDSDRYGTAKAFSDDLQAWLDDKPIAAKPPTILERLSKWRRRNSGLVAVASGLLLFATLGLLTTTLMIWREQHHTADALTREMEQRMQAQRSFQQARSAVERFSNLSESELAYRPDLQDLRRSFLETSLEFYQDFLSDRSSDPALSQELVATSSRVEKMVDELRILDNISPLRALTDERVQRELGMDSKKALAIESAVNQFNDQRQLMANQFVGGLTNENTEMTELAREFNIFITEQLSRDQLDRLRQIVRQERLPFTFKTSEIVAALELTRRQRDDISRIIEETRPNRGDGNHGNGKDGNPKDGPGRGGPPRFGGFGGPKPRQDEDHHGPPNFGFGGPPKGDLRPDSFGEHGQFRFDMARSTATRNTLSKIMEILTPVQRAKWNALIGKPFET